MSIGKYDVFRVPLKESLDYCAFSHEKAALCAAFVLNTIDANSLIRLITIKDEIIADWKIYFQDFVLIENFTTEQFCYFYMALWAIDRLNYYKKTSTDPVSLRLNAEIIDEIVNDVFIKGTFGDSIYTEKFEKLSKEYPAAFSYKSSQEAACILLFSDLWSRATNQVIPLDLLLLTN